MAKQIDVKSAIVNDIANQFFNLLPFYYLNGDPELVESVEDFRKIINNGVVSNTVGQQSKLILYQYDYQAQTPPMDFDIVVDTLSRCYCTGIVTEGNLAEHMCDSDYSEYSADAVLTFTGDGSTPETSYESFEIATNSNSCFGQIPILVSVDVLSILSQYIPFDYTQVNIDPIQANQVLDTNIFELLPQVSERQQQINKFFSDYSNLKGNYPNFLDEDNDGLFDYPTDRENDNISAGGQSIVRTEDDENDVNDNQSLEWLRNDLNLFLEDVDQRGIDDLDDRPIYEDKSDGYLKIRHMNQFIIVRKEEGTDVGIQDSYLTDGFTITMWVKFLDKVNGGTLFNFGNPLRVENPMGFMLETFIVETDEENQRYLRLVVREGDGTLRDSHFGIGGQPRLDTINDTNGLPALEYDSNYASNYTQVPIDLTEWYFIVANYNPNDVNEDGSGFGVPAVNQLPEYWQWNYDGTNYTNFSGLGAKCKVEIISKSDLIRARGFRQS